MDPMKLKLDPAWIVATASSKGDGRPRWTDINVYHLPAHVDGVPFTKRRYVAEVLACSSMQGERTKTRRVACGTLERALDWIEDTDLGAAVKVTAREWALEQNVVDADTVAVLRECWRALDEADAGQCPYEVIASAKDRAGAEIVRLGGYPMKTERRLG